jgi:acyl-CoA thioester hydrolase
MTIRLLDTLTARRYNRQMANFRFILPLEVRYADLDPQWHVNNTRYLTFLEQGRMAYLVRLGLWDGVDFNQLGMIVADVHIAYLAPVTLWQKIRLEMRVTRIGTKSMAFEYQIVDDASGEAVARAESAMVAYDYEGHTSIPVPEDWRQKIAAFEGWTI